MDGRAASRFLTSRRRRLGLTAGPALLAAGLAGVPRGVAAPPPAVDAKAFAGHGRLAFLSRGSLFVLDGDRLRLLASARRQPTLPQFSPDGSWLAYPLGQKRTVVARPDGTAPHVIAAEVTGWLPDGRLLAGRALYRISPSGVPVLAGTAPSGLAAWAADGSRYAFIEEHDATGKDGAIEGVTRLELADSLTGRRKTWFSTRDAFDRKNGWRTSGLADVVVLPARRGVLFWLAPFHSASFAADGLPFYAITAPGARPRKLGFSVGRTASTAADGRFAVGAGSDRYVWRSKHVLTCAGARCTSPSTPTGALTLEPALSPDGANLAYVAAKEERAADFSQSTIRHWYATRRLWIGNREVRGSAGAAFPTWSGDGRSLLFVKDDALWLLPRLDGKPVRVAGPLLEPGYWPSYYGEIGWSSLFAWRPE